MADPAVEYFQQFAPKAPPAPAADDPAVQYFQQFAPVPASVAGQTVSAAAPQVTGPMRWLRMGAGALLHGVATTLGLPGDLAQLLPSGSAEPLPYSPEGDVLAFGGGIPLHLPTSNDLLDAFAPTGVFGTDVIPGQGPHPVAEKALTYPLEAVGATAPLAMFAPEGQAIRTLLAGALGTTAGHVAGEQFPGNALAPLAAGAAGGSLVSDIPSMINAKNVEKIAGTISPYVKTLQQAGSVVKSKAQQWLDNELPAREEQAWSQLDQIMHRAPIAPGSTTPTVLTEDEASLAIPHGPSMTAGPETPLSNLESALKDITKEGATDSREARAAKIMQPRLPGQILSALRGEETEPTISFLQPPRIRAGGTETGSLPEGLRPVNPTNAAPGVPAVPLRPINKPGAGTPSEIPPVSWDFARELRSWLGDGMNDSSSPLFKDLGQKNLSKLYAAVTKDLGETAEAHGAREEFANANSVSSTLRTQAENFVKPITDAKTDEDAISAAMSRAKTGGTRLSFLRSEMPEAADALAAAHLLQTPAMWARLSPEAKAALVPDMRVAAKLDKLIGKPKPSEISRFGEEMIGGSYGEMAGALGHGALGLSEIGGGALGGLLGLTAPPLARLVRRAAAQPGMVLPPTAGALGAGNALLPYPGQQP